MNDLLKQQQDFFLNCKPGSVVADNFYQNFSAPKIVFEERLNIYRRSIQLSLQRALALTYPCCADVFSEDLFNTLSAEFLTQHLPTCSDLNHFGHYFSDFIKQKITSDCLPPYSADLAHFEWVWHKSIFHYNNSALTTSLWQKKIQLEGDQIILLPPKESSWIISPYPLHLIWQKKQDSALEKQNELFYFLIWQKSGLRCMEVLTKEDYLLLNILSPEKTLLDVCMEITGKINPADFPALLGQLVSLSCLSLV